MHNAQEGEDKSGKTRKRGNEHRHPLIALYEQGLKEIKEIKNSALSPAEKVRRWNRVIDRLNAAGVVWFNHC